VLPACYSASPQNPYGFAGIDLLTCRHGYTILSVVAMWLSKKHLNILIAVRRKSFTMVAQLSIHGDEQP
jgi:hypothetical protein